jgi:hypothetical protein
MQDENLDWIEVAQWQSLANNETNFFCTVKSEEFFG